MRLELLVDGQSVGQVSGGLEPGWRHFRFDTASWAGKSGKVTVRLEGKAGLPLMFNVRPVTLPGVAKVSSDRAPVKVASDETLELLSAIRSAELKARSTQATAAKKAEGSEKEDASSEEEEEKNLPFSERPAGAGILAAPDWKGRQQGSVALEQALPVTPEGAYRLAEHLSEAVVGFFPYEGGWELCSAWAETPYYLKGEEAGPNGEGILQERWKCGADKWKVVARTRQKAGGELRDGLWLHPRDNGIVQVTFPQVPMGHHLEGYFGLTDLASGKNDFPSYLEVWVGGMPVLRRQIDGKMKGWAPFSIDTSAWSGQPADLTLRVETDKQRWRHLVLDAMTLNGPTSKVAESSP